MSTQVFYRKYRPSDFASLKGQDSLKDILINSIASNSYTHGYLFTGPRGTGKTTTARILAKAVNCLKFSDVLDVCNECENCNLINENASLDIIELDAASNRGIEEIRQLKESINFLPVNLVKKVYIIDEAHMLTKEAFNALLKTLEEPPEHVLFILATTEVHKVPITILSRIVRLDFNLVSEDVAINKLKKIAEEENIKISEEDLKYIYKISGGSFRDAETFLSKVASSKGESIAKSLGIINSAELKEFIELVNGNEYIDALSRIDDYRFNNVNPNYFIENLLEVLIENFVEQKTINNDLILKLEEILANLNRISSPWVYIKSKFIQYFSNSIPGTSELGDKPIVNIKTEIESKSKTIKKDEVLKPSIDSSRDKVTVEVKAESVSDTVIPQGIIDEVEKEDRRLAAILETSFINIDKGNKTIEILQQFEFNRKYILNGQRLEILNKVVSAANNLSGFKVEVKITNSSNNIAPKEVKETIQSKENKDNSELVESII